MAFAGSLYHILMEKWMGPDISKALLDKWDGHSRDTVLMKAERLLNEFAGLNETFI